MSEQRKSLAQAITGLACVGALIGGTLWYSARKVQPEPIPVYAHREPQDVRAKPYDAVPQYGAESVSLEMLANKSSPWLADGLPRTRIHQ